jgi:hypothetical protein
VHCRYQVARRPHECPDVLAKDGLLRPRTPCFRSTCSSRLAGESGGSVTGCVTGRSRSPASRLLQIMRTCNVYLPSRMAAGLRSNNAAITLQSGFDAESCIPASRWKSLWCIAESRSYDGAQGGLDVLAKDGLLRPRTPCCRQPVGAGLLAKAAGQSPDASQGDRVRQQAGSYRCSAQLTPVRREIQAASRACSVAAPLSTKLPRRHAVGFAEAT